MKSAILAATVFAIGVIAQADSPKINTPTSLVQCQPIKISWSGGKAPYWVSAVPGGQASAAPLKDWGEQTGTELTWTVDLPAGTSISMQVKDSNGDINYAQAVDVRAGSSTDCLANSNATSGSDSVGADAGAGAGGSAASGSAGGNSAAADASSPAAGASTGGAAAASGSAGAASGASKPAGSSGSGSAGTTAPSTAPSSSAGRIAASTGFVGVAALFLATVL